MNINIYKSEYTEHWHKTVVCDRCKRIIASAQCNKKPREDEVSHKMEVEQLLMEIAELKADYKEACDRLQTANLIKDEQLAATRHHKYKRCLAMAKWCREKCEKHRDAAKFWHYYKWCKRWLMIAEQFKDKEAK